MREFNNDSPTVMAFKYNGKEYTIPVAASMPVPDILAMDKSTDDSSALSAQYDFLRKHMGKIVDTIPTKIVGEIMTAWVEESAKVGADVGE